MHPGLRHLRAIVSNDTSRFQRGSGTLLPIELGCGRWGVIEALDAAAADADGVLAHLLDNLESVHAKVRLRDLGARIG